MVHKDIGGNVSKSEKTQGRFFRESGAVVSRITLIISIGFCNFAETACTKRLYTHKRKGGL